MERVPPPDLPSGLTLRNAAYALQWWVFALFALWMWVKMVRDDYRRHQPVPGAQCRRPADGGAHAVSMYPTTTLAKPLQIRKALGIYRVLAIVAGIALFILVVEMVMKYGMHQENWFTKNWSYIHGFIYMAYAASIANLGLKLAWPMLRIGPRPCSPVSFRSRRSSPSARSRPRPTASSPGFTEPVATLGWMGAASSAGASVGFAGE